MADVQTDLAALRASLESEISRLRTLFRFKAQPNDISDVCNADSVDEAADRLTDLLGSLHPQEKVDVFLEFIADFKKVRPDAHKHLSLFESYRTLAILFDQIGSAHVDISKRGGGVKGMSIDERVSSLLDRLALGSLPVPDTEALRERIESLRRYHVTCEDGWYSCPLSPEGCIDDREDGCTCGALEHNIRVDALLSALLSRSAQEPPKEEYEQEALNALTLRVDVAETELRQTIIDRDQARADYQRLDDAAEYLWAVVANVSEGNWHQQPQTWQDAAARARDGYWSSRVSRSRAPQEAINRLGEAPACEQHGAMVADDEFGRRWHCAVCEAVFSPAEAFGLRPEMQPIVDELLRRMSASPPAPAHPKRIQRQRTKGWHMPEGAIYVGRPTKWGNRFGAGHSRMSAQDRFDCVELFREWMKRCDAKGLVALDGVELLRGHDLACWCPLDQPCHADVLLEIANAELSREDAHQEEP